MKAHSPHIALSGPFHPDGKLKLIFGCCQEALSCRGQIAGIKTGDQP
jgi:hypothetical protein